MTNKKEITIDGNPSCTKLLELRKGRGVINSSFNHNSKPNDRVRVMELNEGLNKFVLLNCIL